MKVYQTSEIRNIALVGGARSGKTTLAEAMLFESGAIPRRGTIEDKNTLSDYREIELERKNSVVSSLLHCEYGNNKINILDTPGFKDFQSEVISSLYVAEAGLVCLNAQVGIEVGTEIAFRYANQVNTPLLFVINHLDQEKANFDETLSQLTAYLGDKICISQYPINQGVGFNSVIDLILMKQLILSKGGGKPEMKEIPAEEKEKAEALRLKLVEMAATGSEELMEKYFAEGELTLDEVRKGIRLGLASRSLFPVLCCAAKDSIGVSRLLDFISYNVPSPEKASVLIKNTQGKEFTYSSTEPTCLFAFKTAYETHLGEMCFFKVMNGEVHEAQDMINPYNQSKERLSQLFAVCGKNRVKIEKACAGDLIASIKLKDVKANQCLCTLKNAEEKVEPMLFPEPIYTIAIKAINNADDEKLGIALHELSHSDKTLIVEYSRELKQILLKGQGELHIHTIKWYLEHLYKIPVELCASKIPYRETITKSAEATYRHKKQSGGAGQFGEVHLLIEPYFEGMPNQTKYTIRHSETHSLPWGGKLVFNNCIVGGVIDARFMPAIQKGIMEKMEEGPLTGSYARDIVVSVYDGKMHPVDSNELSFKLAGRHAFREAFKNAGPKILEPMYEVKITLPSESMGNVMTDLQGRRAVVMGMESDGNYQIINASAPLAEMNKYATALNSLSSGRGVYTMAFKEYAPVPTEVQQVLLKAYQEEEADA